MKILYFCNEYYCRYGARTHAREFVTALRERADVETVDVCNEARLMGRADQGSPANSTAAATATVPAVRSRLQRWRRLVAFFLPRRTLTERLAQHIAQSDYDVLLIRANTRLPRLSYLKKRFPRLLLYLEVNTIYFVEDFHDIPWRSLWRRWEMRRYRCADGVMVVSSWLKTSLVAAGIAEEKVLVNANGVNLARFNTAVDDGAVRRRLGVSGQALVLGYVGGMERFRRLPEVITAVAKVRERVSRDIVFIVIGDGEDSVRVRERAAAVDPDGRWLRLPGWVDYEQVPAYVKMFDIAIFPFTNPYCSPIKLFEYLGVAKAVIGPRTPAVTDVFRDGEHLLLVEQDGSDLESRLERLIEDASLRRALAERGHALVTGYYTWADNARRLIEALQRRRADGASTYAPC